ncbi:hypothetical protein N0V90_003352 [Kalmusia sp. IMI 367209]|nr:hypothetical protein N0V90_003352 [Kalmusia sp. IMI 367209]
MTDATTGAAAQAKKKRFGFKKAAWQTAPKAETQEDMFSHSSEFKDIIAEETKRKIEEKRKVEEAKQRKADDVRQRKRRKVSAEPDEKVHASRSGNSDQDDRMASKGRSKTPMSPTRSGSTSDILATRYDSLTKSSSTSFGAGKQSQVIDLVDTDEDEDLPYKASPSPMPPIPIRSRRASSEEVEEVDDSMIAELKAKARARAAAKIASQEPTPAVVPSTQKPKPTAMVQLFIVSEIPNTKPLIIKVKTDMSLERPKNAWCEKQGFSPEQTRDIFMTWKNRRIWDTTTIQRLGVQVDDHGYAIVEGDPTIYDETNLPKIHVEAWTEEVFEQRKKEAALEAARAAESEPAIDEPEPEPEAESQAKQIRLILKAKGKDDFKIKVHGTTEIGHLADAYKKNMGVPSEQPITLMFDGDRLKPMDTIEDADIDDMDAIEVHFK